MSESETPVAPIEPTASAPAPVKKGLSPLAWVGIGCGCLVVLIVVALLAMGAFGVKMAKELAENPAKMAEMIAKMDPNIEVVSVDEDAQKVTFREKDSGKTVTVDLADVKSGKINFTDEEGKEIRVDASDVDEGGGITVRSDDEEMTIQGGKKADLPDWIPEYPGVEPKGVFDSRSQGVRSGAASFEIDAPPEKVAEVYEEALKKEGYVLTRTTHDVEGGTHVVTVIASHEGEGRDLHVTASSEGEGTQVALSYQEK